MAAEVATSAAWAQWQAANSLRRVGAVRLCDPRGQLRRRCAAAGAAVRSDLDPSDHDPSDHDPSDLDPSGREAALHPQRLDRLGASVVALVDLRREE